MKKLNVKPIFRHCFTVLFAFATMGILASMALNLSFLNPVDDERILAYGYILSRDGRIWAA